MGEWKTSDPVVSHFKEFSIYPGLSDNVTIVHLSTRHYSRIKKKKKNVPHISDFKLQSYRASIILTKF